MRYLGYIFLFLLVISCKETGERSEMVNTSIEKNTVSVMEKKKRLEERGFQTFDYVDEATKDTILMQQYFMAFLKRGSNKSLSEAELDSLQALHLAHLGRMYEMGYADISGPFGDNGEIRGITIYNVPTQEMADSLANLDPMVKAGRLTIEIHPWWAAKGFHLR
ncbi:YciI family protein [Arenibacter latericius]|uniref:YciI family protein n=1 Tax=Arenibacter latericius TaxID=86104 RepID=UPI0003FA78F1|nr:phenylalanyl-tRNA synthetase subunit alpha [Arenibacter latericius]